MVDEALAQWAEGRVEELAGRLADRRLTLAVAESLTGGLLTEVLARGPGAAEWLRGGVVAYSSEVKHDLLGVRRGPVVSEAAALDMARGAARVMGADIGLAVTGVGGPDPQDGQPPAPCGWRCTRTVPRRHTCTATRGARPRSATPPAAR